MAALMKTVMAMCRGVIPKHLHFSDPNPNFDWEKLLLQVTSKQVEWPGRGDRPPIAGINSFGLSGTNAHLIVKGYRALSGDVANEECPVPSGAPKLVLVGMPDSLANLLVPDDAVETRQTRCLPLSGKSEKALKELGEGYWAWLEQMSNLGAYVSLAVEELLGGAREEA